MNAIYGAIIGDIAGSVFEGSKWEKGPIEETSCKAWIKMFNQGQNYSGYKIFDKPLLGLDGQRFTDDTVLTCAIANWLLACEKINEPFVRDIILKQSLKLFCNIYPNAGYGYMFRAWCHDVDLSVNGKSFGNGAAMRCSPIVEYYKDSLSVTGYTLNSAIVTHDSEFGVKGAQAIALASHFAKCKNDSSKQRIKEEISSIFKINLDFSLDEKRGKLKFSSDAEITVPLAIIAFLESDSFEDAIRRAISIGGDTDTIANMAGNIAGSYYGVSDELREQARKYLDKNLLNVLDNFENKLKI